MSQVIEKRLQMSVQMIVPSLEYAFENIDQQTSIQIGLTDVPSCVLSKFSSIIKHFLLINELLQNTIFSKNLSPSHISQFPR